MNIYKIQYDIINELMRKGFTIVEVMVTLAIAIAVGIVLLPNLFGGNVQSDLMSTSLQVRVHLGDARINAIDKSEGSSWGVHFSNSSSGVGSYSIFIGNSYATGTVMATYPFPSDVGFASSTLTPGNSRDIVFSPVSGASSVSTTLTFDDINNPAVSSSIVINFLGRINAGTPIVLVMGSGSSGGQTTTTQYLYVVDSGDERIEKLSLSGVFQSQFPCTSGLCPSSPQNGDFSTPNGIAINTSGTIYVLDQNDDRVEEFNGNASDTYITQLGCTTGNCYPGGTGNNQFANPNAITIDPHDNSVYISDIGNNRIMKFSAAGTFLYQIWCSSGACSTGGRGGDNVPGEFLFPAGLAVDSSGNIWVAESNDHLDEWSSSGSYKTQILSGSDYSCSYGVADPTDMIMDSSGSIYVVSSLADCIVKVSTSGIVLSSYTCASGECSIVLDAKNDLYVADPEYNNITEYSPTGTVITAFGAYGAAPGDFNNVEGIWRF